MKNYEIFLCEDYWVDDPNSKSESKKKIICSKIICEIGSSSSNFLGKAYDLIFSSNINGTHELTFSLPSHYFDEQTGEKISNDLVNLLVNKSKILLKFTEEKEEYYLVINNRTDSDSDGKLSYSYSCNDAFIEELSKTGYGLVFSDEVEGNSLGTIHELAEIILGKEEIRDEEGKVSINWSSGWEYDREKTGSLKEYRTELEYNIGQKRYDTVQIPYPVHPIKYIPELKRYCNKLGYMIPFLDNGEIRNREVYCYEDTEQVTSNTVQNLLYNADNFLDLSGWSIYNKDSASTQKDMYLNTEKIDNEYYLKLVTPGTENTHFLLNNTCAAANKTIMADKVYLLKIDYHERTVGHGIDSINIYSKNPLITTGEEKKVTPEYTLSYSHLETEGKELFVSERYYVIKTKETFFTPYVSFGIYAPSQDLFIKSVQLFELKATSSELQDSEENYLNLLSKLSNGMYISAPSGGQTEVKYGFPGEAPKGIIDFNTICLPENTKLSAYTHKKVMYFTLDKWEQGEKLKSSEDTITYLDFETEVNLKNENGLIVQNITIDNSYETLEDIDKDNIIWHEEDKVSIVYKLKSNGKYYQYYQLTRNGETGGAWDYALYGEGASDKRRTLIAEKSNRFNLIQTLAELFKVWAVFEMKTNEDGTISKKVYFKENAIRENFSGFHKGVNLKGLERSVDSDNIVTKMYVEDIDSDFAENGFVTIRTSSLNPWGENYIYNFKYYIEQGILKEMGLDSAGTVRPQVDIDVENLYISIKGKNQFIFDLNDKVANAEVELNNISSNLKSLSYCISAARERQLSLQTDLDTYTDMAEPDKESILDNLETSRKIIEEYEKNYEEVKQKYDILKQEYEQWMKDISALQARKKEEIEGFEKRYSQYIKEGVWSDTSYADDNTYFLDAQKVSLTSAMPEMSWNISAIDGSVLKELEDFKIKVGDQTILIDNDFFKDNNGKEHIFEVLISGIQEHLDDPSQNEIEIRNYLTSFEDLFQRISTATQTLELNEQTYNRAAYFTQDGQVDANILQNTLLNNGLVLSNSSDNSVKLDNTGLHLQAILNPAKKLRAVADGIFISNSEGADGEPQWKTGITADGINASVITTGQLNTSLIKIFSSGQPTFTWGGVGISAYSSVNRIKEHTPVAVIGDSYSIHRNEYITKNDIKMFDYTVPGWIEQLRSLGINTIGISNLLGDSIDGPYGGRGASGFSPYFHVGDRRYYFYSQLEEILSSGNRPEYIVICGGFNDRNMCINDIALSEDGTYYEYTKKTTEIDDIKSNIITVNSNGYTMLNAGNEWKDGSGGTAIYTEIQKCQSLIENSYLDGNLPKVILVTVGRYSDLYDNSSYVYAINNVMLKNVYTMYQKAVESLENWSYYDYSGILKEYLENVDESEKETNEQYKFLNSKKNSYLNGWIYEVSGKDGAHTQDNVHPTSEGTAIVARKLKEILVDVGKASFEEEAIENNGNSFVRLDKFGLYSIRDRIGFNYIEGLPWFTGLTPSQALDKISQESTFSLTDRGLNLNISGKSGKITLGDLLPGNNYGLRITDKQGKDVVKLTNDSEDCTIAGWKIGSRSLLNELSHPSKEKMSIVSYLHTSNTPGETVLALGEKVAADSKYTSVPFRITAEGKLYATNAEITGKIIAERGQIGPFVIESEKSSEDASKITCALLLGDLYRDAQNEDGKNWIELVSEKIASKTIEGLPSLIGFSTGQNKGTDILEHVPDNSDTIWGSAIKGTKTYRMVKNGSWQNLNIENHLKSLGNDFCIYDPLNTLIYYIDGNNAFQTINITEKAISRSALLNKKMLIIKNSFNSKEKPKIYFNASSGLYFKKEIEVITEEEVDSSGKLIKSGEYNIFYKGFSTINTLDEQDNVINNAPFDKQKVYYYSGGGVFIDYREVEVNGQKTMRWKYLNDQDYQMIEIKEVIPIEISDVLPNEIEIPTGKTAQRGYPKETIMWYEKINSMNGYWWYDIVTNQWKWSNNASRILNKIAHKDVAYASPEKTGWFTKTKETSDKKKSWEYVRKRPSNLYPNELSYDTDLVFNIGNTYAYHPGTSQYLFLNSIPEQITSGIIDIQYDTINSIFINTFMEELVLKEKIDRKCYYYSPSGAYFYYNNDEEKWKGIIADYDTLIAQIRNFSYYLPDKNDQCWDDISHIIIGGGWYDRTSVFKGSELIEAGILQFCETVSQRAKPQKDRNGKEQKPKLTIAYLPWSTSVTMQNEIKKVIKIYENAVSKAVKKYSNIDIELKDYSQTWSSQAGAISSNGYLPSSTGVNNIFNLLYAPHRLNYKGMFYGLTEDFGVNGQKVSSGFSLKSAYSGSIALWAGYKGLYTNPFDDRDATNADDPGGWEKRTSFYVTHGGKLHAKDAYIEGEIKATSGEIGMCKIKNGRLSVENADFTNVDISKANIGTISAGVIASGTVKSSVTFEDIHAKGGYVGGWEIGDFGLKKELDDGGDIFLDPVTGMIGLSNVPEIMYTESTPEGVELSSFLHGIKIGRITVQINDPQYGVNPKVTIPALYFEDIKDYISEIKTHRRFFYIYREKLFTVSYNSTLTSSGKSEQWGTMTEITF